MSMVIEFLNHMRKLVDEEEMSDVAKGYFLDDISQFQERWEQRVSPDYDAIINSLKEQLEKAEYQKQGLLAELKDYENTVTLLRKQINEMSERENHRVTAFEDELAEARHKLEQLQYEKQETVEDYEKQITNCKRKIDHLAHSQGELHRRATDSEELVFRLTAFLTDYKLRNTENY